VINLEFDMRVFDILATYAAGDYPQSLRSQVQLAAFRGVENAIAYVVDRAKYNAPWDTTRLRASIVGVINGFVIHGDRKGTALLTAQPPRPRIGPAPRPNQTTITGAVVADAPHAFFVHEFMVPGTPPALMRNGMPLAPNKFRNHPTTEGGTGGKFIERVVKHPNTATVFEQGFNFLMRQALGEFTRMMRQDRIKPFFGPSDPDGGGGQYNKGGVYGALFGKTFYNPGSGTSGKKLGRMEPGYLTQIDNGKKPDDDNVETLIFGEDTEED
jgi:hypothetical protein